MNRPDPIEYAERLYDAIRAANFSPISFLAFGNAVKDGVALRNLPRIAAEPFMRIVGEMLDLEEEASESDIIDAETIAQVSVSEPSTQAALETPGSSTDQQPPVVEPVSGGDAPTVPVASNERRRNGGKR